MVDTADIVAIHQLIGLYGHVVDDRDWGRAGDLFTPDVVYDVSDFGKGVWNGLEEVRGRWISSDSHPLAHHASNIVVFDGPDGSVAAVSKGIGVGNNGRVGSVVYRYKLRREAEGWRIAELVATLRRSESADG